MIQNNNKLEIQEIPSRKELKESIYKQFDSIYDGIILSLIKEYQKELNVKHYFGKIKKFLLKRYYYRYNKVFMNKFMRKRYMRLDMHKISASIIKSILIVRPLSIPIQDIITLFFHSKINDKRFIALFNVNELLALSVAFNIMDNCMEAKDFSHPIHLPVPFVIAESSDDCLDVKKDDRRGYIYSVCLDLSYTRGYRLDLLSYANIFFLIEKYSCRKTQCDNLEQECKKLLKKYEHLSEAEINQKIKEIKFRTVITEQIKD